MSITETVEGSRARHFMLNGEYYGEFWLQRDQFYALVNSLDGLAPTTHIPSEVVGFAYGFSAMIHSPIALIAHEQSLSVQEKSNILMAHHEDIAAQLGVREASVLPLKTITLRFKHEGSHSYVLFTRIGDYLLDRDTERYLIPSLKRLLQVEHNPLGSGSTINPLEFDPRRMLGIEPGLVSPFVRANVTNVLKGLLYYRDESLDSFVAVAVSPYDTLIVDKTVFNLTLNWWQGDFLGVPFRAVVKSTGDQSVVNK